MTPIPRIRTRWAVLALLVTLAVLFAWANTGSASASATITQTSTATPTALGNGTEYQFAVRAHNRVGNSAASNLATPTPSTVPGTPTNVSAKPGNTRVTLTWTAPSTNGGSPITDYEYQQDSGGWTSTGSATKSVVIKNLTNGTSYSFRVRARNANGVGPQSAKVSATPAVQATAPSAVRNPSGTPGDDFADLDWDAPSSNGGSAITRYEYRTPNDPWASTKSTDTFYRATTRSNGADLANGTSYGFRIRACNDVGCGTRSPVIWVTPNNQPPAFATDTASRSVAENSAVGTNVGAVITATDPEDNIITYSITGTNEAGFTVTSGGQIQTGQSLDHEEEDQYTVNLRATARGGKDNITVTIKVIDMDEAPAFAQDSYSRSVDENVASGTNVGAVITATDPEGDTISYSLSGSGSGNFAVSSNGQITVTGSLDHEFTPSYTLTLTATAGSLSGTTKVNIAVSDVAGDATISSVAVASSTVTRTSATAEATFANPESTTITVYFRYRTPPSSGDWTSGGNVSSNGTTASVRLTGLDDGAQYRVQASLYSTFASTVQVDFTTTANNAPTFPSATVTRAVEENRLGGTRVGNPVTATDAEGDAITYTLGGTDAASFDLDGSTGQLTVGATTSLDFETKSSYSVTVTATDSLSATGSVNVTIEVTDVREAGFLGRIVITVGYGSHFGYGSGSYGTLDSGEFPGALFNDGNDRTVAEMYEDTDGDWVFVYSGGLANDWLSDQDQLNEITVDVFYEGNIDNRSFVLGGFIESRPGTHGLRLDPPLPGRDWEGRYGQEVALEFRRHTTQVTAPALPGAIIMPRATAGSLGEALNNTPGGPVVVQMLLTAIVSIALLFTPERTFGQDGGRRKLFVVLGAIALTPWAPVAIFGIGDLILSSILTGVMALAAILYRQATKQPR